MLKLLLIFAGGGVGTLLRWAVAGWVQRAAGTGFPAGTMVVNVAGCLAIGLLGAYFAGPQLVRPEVRDAILIGLLGAFTTFSTFGWETLELLRDNRWLAAAANIAMSNGVGLLGVWAGYRLGS